MRSEEEAERYRVLADAAAAALRARAERIARTHRERLPHAGSPGPTLRHWVCAVSPARDDRRPWVTRYASYD